MKCSYYFVRLLLKTRLSCRSLPEFFPSCFDVLSHSRSSISVCSTIATIVYQTPMRLLSKFLYLYYLATAFLHLATFFSLIVAKRQLEFFFLNFEPCSKGPTTHFILRETFHLLQTSDVKDDNVSNKWNVFYYLLANKYFIQTFLLLRGNHALIR